MTRNCPACGADRPQKGWGYGFRTVAGAVATTAAWVCGDCREDKDKIDAQAARGKRFTVVADIDPMSRYKLAYELERGTGLAVGEINRPLLRIVAALKDRDWTGQIDIDLEGVEKAELESAEIVMRNSLDRTHGSAFTAGDRLVRALADFRYDGEPPKPPARIRLTDAELSALQHGEKPISKKDSESRAPFPGDIGPAVKTLQRSQQAGLMQRLKSGRSRPLFVDVSRICEEARLRTSAASSLEIRVSGHHVVVIRFSTGMTRPVDNSREVLPS